MDLGSLQCGDPGNAGTVVVKGEQQSVVPLSKPLTSVQNCGVHLHAHRQKCGTIKDVQRMLRHSSQNLTVGVYMLAIPESAKQAVNTLEEMIGMPEEDCKVSGVLNGIERKKTCKSLTGR